MKKAKHRLSEKSIRRKAYLYSCDSIPSILIETIIKKMPPGYLGNSPDERIKNIAKKLKRFLTEVRIKLPNMSILEWYEISLVCFNESSNKVIESIENSETKTWIECKSKFQNSLKDSLKFAVNVIESVKKKRKRYEVF